MFVLKCTAFLLFQGLGVLMVAELRSSLGVLLFLYSSRVLWQLSRWKRNIHWLEATVESWVLLPAVVLSCAVAPSAESWGWSDATLRLAGCAVCVGGNVAVVVAERHCEESSRSWCFLCVDGWYAVVRHPNYLAEIVSFVGFAWAGGQRWAAWNMWVPVCMAAGMMWWSVGDLERHLTARHGTKSAAWRAEVPHRIFPRLW